PLRRKLVGAVDRRPRRCMRSTMASLSQWVQGARPKTLPAALAPVAAGTGAAVWQLERLAGDVDWGLVLPRALLALAVSFSLQVGVNYANDYSDGIRGTDDDRVGPFRLTGSRAAKPETVKRAAIGALALGGLCGIMLVAVAQIWWALVIGAAAIAAAWFYTGGQKPHGFLSVGAWFAFVFCGLVAGIETAYAITTQPSLVALLASLAIGLLAVGLTFFNNRRDIAPDVVAGNRSLAVRLGERGSR